MMGIKMNGMGRKIKSILAGFFALSPLFLGASHQGQMLGDLKTVTHAFEVSYAPLQWKKEFSGWDLAAESEAVENFIKTQSHLDTKDFQKLLKQFLNTAKDYHVRVLFYSTESASLPFRIKGANGKYFISHINRDKLSSKTFPFFEGDELVLFDDRPVDEVIQELKDAEMSSNPKTDQRLAEICLTHRQGKLGQTVPKGPVTVTLLPDDSHKPISHQLIWDYKQEKIPSLSKQASKSMSLSSKAPHAKSLKKSGRSAVKISKQEILKDPIFHKLLLAPHVAEMMSVDGDDDLDFAGSEEGFIPPLGPIWWQTDENSFFRAYLFELEDHQLIGYIRIPSYMPPMYRGSRERNLDQEERSDPIKEFAKIIAFLEKRSKALVIDQVDNPGGSVFYLYALASMLSDQPLATPRHRIALTQADVYAATRMIPIFESIHSDEEAQDLMGDTFNGIAVTHQLTQFMLNFFRFIIEEWNAGRQLTNPYFLYGIDHINPHPKAQYTKPILVLVNSLDFSGGDFFPAILQDNQRAVIMGSRTAGAGGFISYIHFPNLNGISEIRFTASIAERADKSPIENLGVVPDIFYEETENDLRYEYGEYAEEIRRVLKFNLMHLF